MLEHVDVDDGIEGVAGRQCVQRTVHELAATGNPSRGLLAAEGIAEARIGFECQITSEIVTMIVGNIRAHSGADFQHMAEDMRSQSRSDVSLPVFGQLKERELLADIVDLMAQFSNRGHAIPFRFAGQNAGNCGHAQPNCGRE